jgi:hypothetical protein
MNFSALMCGRAIDTSDVLKALGISLVLLNHSTWHNLQGGVNILLLISGLNFARFSFKKDNIELAKDVVQLLKKLLIPSLLLIGFYSLVFARFDWKELLLISNFFYPQKIAAFPVWYVEVITQLMLLIIILAFVFNFAKWTRTSPLGFSLIILVLSLLLPVLIDQYINSATLFWKLPHYIAWNFVLGWLLWACVDEENPSPIKLTFCWLVTVASAYLVLQVYQDIPINRFIIFSVCATALIFFRKITLPRIFYRPTIILASAVFYIFLLHGGVMYLVTMLTASHFTYATTAVLKFVISMFACCLFFILSTATANAFKKVTRASAKNQT